ncbi:LTA synthase family protein [Companilactobacillus bobalius]|uniref:Phosphatidylglycerol--membrane-oligosaccharide glycerophosphotransferase n=2 Tax=Companilactobacillus bobalius TaxID=2801451 RepID=A0A202F888_9LACO|nr:LTA synthase family protein [Companilactobacillus bobalius]GEO58922.1 alkaline phosphatase [Companilactobacillus paralimentarius]KAE9559553.1 alkaline phosphatase [Companilactobacillus bobalius]KAE9564082.1 alkaline phosphatase [Companilactobacillus bobalius]KRK83575.1 phosphoglycerol transferase [Companilactobacillus bobalius DSM 19674]OVE96658.1 Phosphatidylglycerol--membrane-oligosaccharide glycerophosphotransferase [Companilactobacillus bobalius]
MKKIKSVLNTRLGFMTFLILCLWLKTIVTYYLDFSLGIENFLQHFLLIVNPFATLVLLMSVALYFNRGILSYIAMGIIYIADSIFIYSNVLYFRSFSDFISFNSITGVGKVAKGLGTTTLGVVQARDAIYLIDIVIIALLFIFHFIKVDRRPFRKLNAVATTCLGLMLFSADLAGSEANRPQLLGRTFDHSYIVKYLGINAFLPYDSIRSAQNDQVRSTATESEMDKVLDYVHQNYAAPNPTYFGKANGKNIIIIHLESFEQFLIGLKVNGQEVTPFLNKLYHDKNTIAYDNFFNEVGSGRTSDAETMLESGLFGLPAGTSVFTKLGTSNTFQAAPAILAQKKGYTSAVFHGNVGSFWDRNSVYKNMGYNYFFDKSYYDTKNPDTASLNTYGIKDKLLLSESAKYLEQMQQPFYTKFLTVTNHVRYQFADEDNDNFKSTDLDDDEINQYFKTAHYLDKSVEEFFNYLNDTGLSKNSMIVLYGDHYGLDKNSKGDSQHKELATGLFGQDPDTWSKFNETQYQRVPFMIHMNGLKGGIKHTYGGEIDVLPTVLHLAGVNTSQYVQLGTDLLSKQHSSVVAFRNKSLITPKYTVYPNDSGSPTVYENKTGQEIPLKDNPRLAMQADKWLEDVSLKLKVSDNVNNKNLLRFYTPTGFIPVNPTNYSYQNQVQQLVKRRDELGVKSTSIYSRNGNKSTTNLYNTDALQLQDDRSPIDSWSYLGKKEK